jgi:hypothetical protein
MLKVTGAYLYSTANEINKSKTEMKAKKRVVKIKFSGGASLKLSMHENGANKNSCFKLLQPLSHHSIVRFDFNLIYNLYI